MRSRRDAAGEADVGVPAASLEPALADPIELVHGGPDAAEARKSPRRTTR